MRGMQFAKRKKTDYSIRFYLIGHKPRCRDSNKGAFNLASCYRE